MTNITGFTCPWQKTACLQSTPSSIAKKKIKNNAQGPKENPRTPRCTINNLFHLSLKKKNLCEHSFVSPRFDSSAGGNPEYLKKHLGCSFSAQIYICDLSLQGFKSESLNLKDDVQLFNVYCFFFFFSLLFLKKKNTGDLILLIKIFQNFNIRNQFPKAQNTEIKSKK